jgi:pSer/pThr/pTyr-binding forkhead associated (FHA) protein
MAAPVFQLQTVAELQARLQAERSGLPFLQYRDGDQRQLIVTLPENTDEVAIGRRVDPGIQLDWDREVSRLHVLLQRVGGLWTAIDDGPSRNGTYINGTRLAGRRVLTDGDALQCGGVVLEFRDPTADADRETIKAQDGDVTVPHLSPAQRRVLIALCRPLHESTLGLPATNKQIAAELSLSVEAVKTHLRRISEVLQVHNLPQNEKRATLARQAINSGVISVRELLSDP